MLNFLLMVQKFALDLKQYLYTKLALLSTFALHEHSWYTQWSPWQWGKKSFSLLAQRYLRQYLFLA